MTDPKPADPLVQPARGASSPRLSVVWLVPILALAVSLGIAWQSYADRGSLIEIAFESASGVAADKTELKYRDVTVGLVEDVSFSEDLTEVIVSVRVDRTLAPYLDSEAEFWVVRPEVSAQGISGLNTVLSGVYIEGRWDSEAGVAEERFTGLERAPLADAAGGGMRIRMRARDGNSILAGAPIIYKGIPVGKVEAPELSEDGDAVIINGFIEAPYDRIVSENTRFWDISGVSVSLGPGGVTLDFSSVASLVQGGISFDTLVAGGADVAPDHTFPLYPDEDAARDSLLDDPTQERLMVKAIFDGTVGGLNEGSAVRFRGLPVGEVESVSMIASDIGSRKVVRLHATLAINPNRLGLGEEADAAGAMELLTSYVSQGMRVRLTTASILSSELVVDLVELPEEGPGEIGTGDGDMPILPTVEADVADLNASAEGVFKRINNLPIEDLLASIQGLIDSANQLIVDEDTQAIAPGINDTLAELRTLGPGVNQTMAELRKLGPELTETLTEVEATLTEFRQIAASLQENGAVDNVNNVFNSASSAADAVESAAGELPKLTARLNALATRTESVLQAYDDNSRLITGALSTLRDISEAADALRSLARTIQRNPSSLVTGR